MYCNSMVKMYVSVGVYTYVIGKHVGVLAFDSSVLATGNWWSKGCALTY